MSIRTKVLSITLATIAIPAVAFAAFNSPSDLLAAVEFKGQPQNISYMARVDSADFHVAATVKGQMQMKDVKSAKSNLQVTVNGAMEGETLRMALQIRVSDSVLYTRIASVSGTMARQLKSSSDVKIGQWYKFPLDKSTAQELGMQAPTSDESAQIARTVIDTLLQMKKDTGNVYDITIKPNPWNELAAALTDIYAKYDENATAPTAAALKNAFAGISLHIKVPVDANDTPKSLKIYASYKNYGIDFVVQGTSTLRSSPVTVAIPAGAIMYEPAGYSAPTESSLGNARDAQRRSDVNSILNATYQYAIDHNGSLPAGISTVHKQICKTDSVCNAANLNLDMLTGVYLVKLPLDPQADASGSATTGYVIYKDASGRITVEASLAENGKISVTR